MFNFLCLTVVPVKKSPHTVRVVIPQKQTKTASTVTDDAMATSSSKQTSKKVASIKQTEPLAKTVDHSKHPKSRMIIKTYNATKLLKMAKEAMELEAKNNAINASKASVRCNSDDMSSTDTFYMIPKTMKMK